ncbi:MAG: SEL1-like repeat protein [Gammaproteobacteria bacterium]|nr:SEL1-like repeat protein [Gammaproteobacteria bacterium]
MIKKALLLILFVSYYSLADEVKTLKQEYIDQISAKIHSEWRLIKAKADWKCTARIIQDRQGRILKSGISDCNTTDKRFVKQLQKAIDKSSPLPKAPSGLFDEELTLHFKAKKDIDLVKSMRKGVRNGNPAALELAQAFRDGIKKAAEAGNPEFMEMYQNHEDYSNAIKAYRAGNKAEAVISFITLANKNHWPSQYNLGDIYSFGQGVPRDLTKSFYWMNRAAQSGRPKTEYAAAHMLHYGIGTSKDIDKAIELYERAAEQDHEPSLFALGEMYYNGTDGVKVNKLKAKELMQRSADEGYLKAQVFLDKNEF